MWSCVRPGGWLVLTVPCACEAFEEYVDRNEYGLLSPDERGLVLDQRFYDERLREGRFFAPRDRPARMAVIGERKEGPYFSDLEHMLLGEADAAMAFEKPRNATAAPPGP